MAELLLLVVVAITSNNAEAEVAGEDEDVVAEAVVAGVVVSTKPNEVVASLPFLARKLRLTDRLGKLRKLLPRLYVCIHTGYISFGGDA